MIKLKAFAFCAVLFMVSAVLAATNFAAAPAFADQPPQCKICKSADKVVPIVWGETRPEHDPNTSFSGGCCKGPEKWYCNTCKKKF